MKNREIKFKGKSLRNGEWIVGQYHTYGDGIFICQTALMSNNGRDWRVPAIEVEPDSVGEYTGMRDKNNKDIYEGDICECETEAENFGYLKLKGIMQWWQDEARFSIKFASEIDFENRKVKSVEIVGNVFDNSELNG